MLTEVLLFVVALVYSSTGHGGGSGYLAILLLTGFSATQAVPVALALNLFVATTALLAFHRAGGAAPRLLVPLVACGVPFAFLGGQLALPDPTVAWLVGPALLVAATLLVVRPQPGPRRIGWLPLGVAGAGLGLLAGVTGIGGGIYLTPILLLSGWAGKDRAAWTSAGFVLANSVAGLAARAPGLDVTELAPFLAPAILGGLIGSALGAFSFSPSGFRLVMAAVLALAGIKTLIRTQGVEIMLGTTEMIILVAVVVLLFGASAIPKLARSLGKAQGEYQKARSVFEDEISAAKRAASAAGDDVAGVDVRRAAGDLGIAIEGRSDEELRRLIRQRLA